MKHRVLAAAVLGAAAWLALAPTNSFAFGGKLFHRSTGGDCGGCAAPAAAACDSSYGHAPAYGYAPACGTAAVTYVEQEVEVLVATEVKTPTKVKVSKMVEVLKDVTYKVATMKPTKQEVSSYQWVQVKKPYEYHVNKLVLVNEKRDYMECVRTSKETLVDVVTYQCVPKMVVVNVPVSRQVPIAPTCGMTGGCGTACADACAPVCAPACHDAAPKRVGLFKRLCGGGTKSANCGTSGYGAAGCGSAAPACGPMYTTVVEMVPTQTCVYENVAIKSQVKQISYTDAWVKKSVDVQVQKCVTTLEKGERMVSECVLVKSMVDVMVCEWLDKKDKVKVWECVQVEETVDVISCKWVATKKKVQVAVAAPVVPCTTGYAAPYGPSCAPACAPAYAPSCEPACGNAGANASKGGLFKRLCHKNSTGGC